MKITKLKSVLALSLALCAGAIAGCGGGCAIFRGAPIATNADPVVVHAQRTREYALATFDAFLRWEKENRALLNDPGVKAAADNIRANYKKWDDDLGATIKAYQAIRSKENADKLDTALALMSQAIDIASRYFLTKTITPPKPPQ